MTPVLNYYMFLLDFQYKICVILSIINHMIKKVRKEKVFSGNSVCADRNTKCTHAQFYRSDLNEQAECI